LTKKSLVSVSGRFVLRLSEIRVQNAQAADETVISGAVGVSRFARSTSSSSADKAYWVLR
jgi:hypothetical protein